MRSRRPSLSLGIGWRLLLSGGGLLGEDRAHCVFLRQFIEGPFHESPQSLARAARPVLRALLRASARAGYRAAHLSDGATAGPCRFRLSMMR